MTFLLASNNSHKKAEIGAIVRVLNSAVRVTTPSERGVRFDVDETAESYVENALLKCRGLLSLLDGVPRPGTTSTPHAAEAARSLARADDDLWILADDSGIEVAALGGRPGVRSARYGAELSNPPRDDTDRYRLLLAELGANERREAAFVCAIVAAQPHGRLVAAQERWNGTIAVSPQIGDTGFGYDPVFIPEGIEHSASLLPGHVKNRISHRALALKTVLAAIEQ